DDDDINDVASMAGVNLNEESARILATNSELVGTQIRSCKDEAFLHPGLLHRRILETAKKFGVTEVPMEAVTFISHATQSRLRTVVEKVSIIAQHRLDSCKGAVGCHCAAPGEHSGAKGLAQGARVVICGIRTWPLVSPLEHKPPVQTTRPPLPSKKTLLWRICRDPELSKKKKKKEGAMEKDQKTKRPLKEQPGFSRSYGKSAGSALQQREGKMDERDGGVGWW
ncbi:hypothetical protein CHARACLAT_023006, partial [Characodon lateralis]|nr:hypothetical protein [Characodon lateralis]